MEASNPKMLLVIMSSFRLSVEPKMLQLCGYGPQSSTSLEVMRPTDFQVRTFNSHFINETTAQRSCYFSSIKSRQGTRWLNL